MTILKPLAYLRFWRRKKNSVEEIEELRFDLTYRKKKNVPVPLLHEVVLHSGDYMLSIDKNQFAQTLTTLFDTMEDAFQEEYLSYAYEEDKSNFALGFFLIAEYQDSTYQAIKGIHPFKQPHYQDILALFAPYYTLIEKAKEAK